MQELLPITSPIDGLAPDSSPIESTEVNTSNIFRYILIGALVSLPFMATISFFIYKFKNKNRTREYNIAMSKKRAENRPSKLFGGREWKRIREPKSPGRRLYAMSIYNSAGLAGIGAQRLVNPLPVELPASRRKSPRDAVVSGGPSPNFDNPFGTPNQSGVFALMSPSLVTHPSPKSYTALLIPLPFTTSSRMDTPEKLAISAFMHSKQPHPHLDGSRPSPRSGVDLNSRLNTMTDATKTKSTNVLAINYKFPAHPNTLATLKLSTSQKKAFPSSDSSSLTPTIPPISDITTYSSASIMEPAFCESSSGILFSDSSISTLKLATPVRFSSKSQEQYTTAQCPNGPQEIVYSHLKDGHLRFTSRDSQVRGNYF